MKKGQIFLVGALALGMAIAAFGTLTNSPVSSVLARKASPDAQSDNSSAPLSKLSDVRSAPQAEPRGFLRANPSYDVELTKVSLGANLPALMERAQNDPPFAYSLAMALQSCASTEAALDAMPPNIPEAEKERFVQSLADASAPCADLGESTAEVTYDLISSAAASGVLEAQISFRALAARFVFSEGALKRAGLVDEYKRRTVSYAREAAKSGTPEALFNAYGVMSSDLFGAADPVKAYAYLHAYNLARPSKGSALLLTASRKGLSAQQLVQAEAQGRSLISTN